MRISERRFSSDPSFLRRAELSTKQHAQLGRLAEELDAVEAAAGEAASVNEHGVGRRIFPAAKRPERFVRCLVEVCVPADLEAAPNQEPDRAPNVAVHEVDIDDLPGTSFQWLTCKLGERYVLIDVAVSVRDGGIVAA